MRLISAHSNQDGGRSDALCSLKREGYDGHEIRVLFMLGART